ncbi:hypothetical protein V6N11_045051 [Hibiscus sabdariffa]|uniref:Secreted protein n=1 Tax=Hibiscus sabdariffa TaxID=183260 RepID=A0ABR1ZQL4_9ROSI
MGATKGGDGSATSDASRLTISLHLLLPLAISLHWVPCRQVSFQKVVGHGASQRVVAFGHQAVVGELFLQLCELS